MIQHCVTRFVLNKPWRRNCRDSITNMSLEEQRKQSRLILLFKFINELLYICSQYLLGLSPATHTRSNHSLKLQHIYARTNQYSYSFLPCKSGCITYTSVLKKAWVNLVAASIHAYNLISLLCRNLKVLHTKSPKHMAEINQHQLLYKFILLSGTDLTLLMCKPTLSTPIVLVDCMWFVKLIAKNDRQKGSSKLHYSMFDTLNLNCHLISHSCNWSRSR